MNESIVITPTIPGLREYPPLIFAWQKWPMELLEFEYKFGVFSCWIAVFYERNGVSYARRFFLKRIPPERVSVLYYDKNGITAKSLERFYRLAHLTFSVFASGDSSIRAFTPEPKAKP